jgi:hypothetical protein
MGYSHDVIHCLTWCSRSHWPLPRSPPLSLSKQISSAVRRREAPIGPNRLGLGLQEGTPPPTPRGGGGGGADAFACSCVISDHKKQLWYFQLPNYGGTRSPCPKPMLPKMGLLKSGVDSPNGAGEAAEAEESGGCSAERASAVAVTGPSGPGRRLCPVGREGWLGALGLSAQPPAS